jgi:hypothetical protein
MKLFAVTLIPLFALLPTAFGAYTFSIAGGTPPLTWNVQNTQTNAVTIEFDTAQAPNPDADYNVAVAACGLNTADFSVSPATAADAADLVVTFTNLKHITATTYCIDVSLRADGIATPLATKRFEYAVTAVDMATVNVNLITTDLTDVTTNAIAEVGGGVKTGNVDPGLALTAASTGPYRFGDSVTIQIQPGTGFDTEITAVGVPCGTVDETANSGRIAFPGASTSTFLLPLTCYADGTRASVTITATVDWWVNNASVRRLRGLQDNEELPESGYFDYAMEVELVALEDGSTGYVTKFYYCASAASAGVAAALLL